MARMRVGYRAVTGVILRLWHGMTGVRIDRHCMARMRVGYRAVTGVILCHWHGMTGVRIGCRAVVGMIFHLRHGMACMRIGRLGLGHGVPGMWIHCSLCFSAVARVARMRILCECAATGGQCNEQQGVREGFHASILTSRIMPASMWYSRWQWKAQRPKASARTR